MNLKNKIFTIIFCGGISIGFAQTQLKFQNNHTELVINDSIKLKKGGIINIYLPANKDFVFVRQKKTGLNTKLISNVAGVVGTGASIIGFGGNAKTLENAVKVVRTANTIQYSADAINEIQSLPISKKAMKIADKEMIIESWNLTDDGWVIEAEFEKKIYEILIQEAFSSGEIKF